MSSAARQTRRVHLDGCGQAAVGLGFAAFGAELPELEARCHERLHYARPTVLAATEDPQGTRVLNLFACDCKNGWTSTSCIDASYSLCITRAATLPDHPSRPLSCEARSPV